VEDVGEGEKNIRPK